MIPATCYYCHFAEIESEDDSVGIPSCAYCSDELMGNKAEEMYYEVEQFEKSFNLRRILRAKGVYLSLDPEDFAVICPAFQPREHICSVCGNPLINQWNGWRNMIYTVVGWNERIVCSRECEKYGQIYEDLRNREFAEG